MDKATQWTVRQGIINFVPDNGLTTRLLEMVLVVPESVWAKALLIDKNDGLLYMSYLCYPRGPNTK